jgi:hypothetical protein
MPCRTARLTLVRADACSAALPLKRAAQHRDDRMSTTRFRVRFAVHVTEQYQSGFLSELAENSGANVIRLKDGSVEIEGFGRGKAPGILAGLQTEEARGNLQVEEAS